MHLYLAIKNHLIQEYSKPISVHSENPLIIPTKQSNKSWGHLNVRKHQLKSPYLIKMVPRFEIPPSNLISRLPAAEVDH